ncbi:MAG: YitT family protein [Acutalibacteraceae bacterium]
MSKKELAKRYILFILGLFFSGIGVAFTKHGELGVSPVSSVANVMSYKFDFFSMGVWLIIWNCVLIVGQIVILRKDFKPYQLLQLPLSFLFGYFTDFGMWLVSFIPVNSYFSKLLMLFIGIVVLAFGISLTVIANVIMNSGEAFVKAISDKTKREFGNIKVVFDISCVAFSIILSLLFFDMKIVGTREGTIISAVLTGFVIKLFLKLLKNKLERILVK